MYFKAQGIIEAAGLNDKKDEDDVAQEIEHGRGEVCVVVGGGCGGGLVVRHGGGKA